MSERLEEATFIHSKNSIKIIPKKKSPIANAENLSTNMQVSFSID